MSGPCPYVCLNKTDYGYCRSTACTNKTVHVETVVELEYDLCKDNAMCCDEDCKKCAQRIYKAYMNERNKQVTAYWTGRLTSDNSFAEGYASWFTEEDKRKYDDMEKHKTHCSNCKGSFDDRKVVYWRYCPYCGATIVKKETK